jgi:iron complex transport system substrate-binding protein
MKRRTLLGALAAAPLLPPLLPLLAAGARASEGATSIIAATFGRLPAPADVRRVFAGGPPASALLAVLAPEKLLGWPWNVSAEARAWLPPAVRELPQVGRLAGRGSTMSNETLLQLQPDLILDIGTVDATYISAMQRVAEQTGLPCVLVHGRLAEHPTQLREVGRLLGVAARGERLAAWAEETIALAERVLAAVPPEKRPRVYYARGAGGLETGLAGSINMETIDFAGGRNVAAESGRGGIAKVSLEQVLGWDPDVILTQDREFARRVLVDPLWRPLAAVRERRVHLAPTRPFGWLDVPPSINRLIGVRWLLTLLHPGRADDAASLRAATADFYRLFYGVEPGAAAFDALLSGEA